MRHRRALRFVALALLLAVIAVMLVAGSRGWLSIEQLRVARVGTIAVVAAHPVPCSIGFFLLCVVATALCFPAAPLIGAAGGAMFGFAIGFPLVLIASTIGSTLACAGARYAFRRSVTTGLTGRIASITSGFERHGPAYLLAMRLNPLVPYWPVNLVMGLTRMRLTRFAPITLVGLAPSILLYTIAGTRLASLRTLGDMISTDLIAAMAALSALPLLFDWLVLSRSRKLSRHH